MQYQKKIIFIIAILIIFLRVIFAYNFYNYNTFDIVEAEIAVFDNSCKIEKIDGKFLFKNSYTELKGLENGYYKGTFQIQKISKSGKRSVNFKLKVIEIKKNKPSFINRYVNNLIERSIKKESPDFKNFVRGVAGGDSRWIHQDIKDMFRYTGLSHIIAMSGMHVGIIFFMFSFILLKLKLSRELRGIILIFILSFYFLGINVSPSFTRAYIMGTIFILGKVFYENIDVWKSIFISIFISVLIFPNSLFSVSFVLSYTGVIAIITLYPSLRRINIWNLKMLDYSIFVLSIQLLLAPLFMYYFKTIPFLSFFSNLLIVPIATICIFIIYLGIFLEIFYLGFLISPISSIIYRIFMEILYFLNKVPFLTIKINYQINIFQVLGIYSLIFTLLYIKNWRNSYENNKKRMQY